ncbi:MAG: AMP-binding protein, partial [Candidatus Delongbacteria bacterium]|nr:AMP-binding protein [Candidatus Delongbacteria bacterium]
TSDPLKKDKIKENDYLERFDLEEIPFRVLLCKLSEENHEIIISFHHILLDGWSTGIILKEFFENYNSLNKNLEIGIKRKVEYKQYIKYLRNQDKEDVLKYWSVYLQDLETCRLSNISYENTLNENTLKHSKSDFTIEGVDLGNISKQANITGASIVYGAWALLLSNYTNSSEVCFGTTISGRNINIDIENTAGLFINTIPLFTKIESDTKVIDFLKSIQGNLNNREEFENISLSDIISVTNNKTSGIFDTIVVIENYPIDKELSKSSEFIVNAIEMKEETNYPLTLSTFFEDKPIFTISYNLGIFSEEQIDRIIESLKIILETFSNNSNLKVKDLSIISSEEKHQLLYDFNDTTADFPRDKTIHELFEEQVERTPDSIALVFEDKEMSYGELNSRSNQLARSLRDNGVVADTIIGIMTDRSFEMIVGILGILKSGGAYLPIDP